ncbi:sodium-coupled monocarboxylate transporter 1 [Dipodomys spectabilis]|uniref:sodium-coupled monocarboxylate transporter 1 n=1 Tax=Dipodomys spectabilis TaxID=105255 RepID=UPI001C54471A|nr:sodium-coupled monocarboxylate transporter 1 [Dipodomys spectabilis]XP_042549224.1 sodium-coupled monocarboxylate transporter 1 [Dipodomys spectabilis]
MDARRDIGGFVVWDYVVFAGMLLISAAIGIYYAFAGGGQQTSKDFLMGGRSMTAVPVAMSLTASFMSAVTVLGTPSEVYRFGAVFSVFAISYFLVVLISAEVFLPVFYKLGITSTYEYLELRFNRCIRLCGTVLFIVQTILYTGIVIYAPALALNQVTGFDLWGAVVATGVVCTFYCTLGGLKAVVWTDVFQVGIMVAGFASVIIQATVTQGGINKIIDDAYNGGRLNFWNFNPNPLQRHTFWTIIIGGTFTWTSIYGINQSQVQRYISCKSRFQGKLSLYINLVGLWVILTCSVLCGLALYSRYRECDPWTSKKVSEADQLMPYLVLDILQDFPGVPGLFVACAYSGTLSTVSSSINALAAVTVEDLIKPHFTSLSERSLSWVSQGMSVLFGALCIGMAALASLMGALLQAALSIFGMIGGPLLGLFSLGILVPFANSLGALSGLLAGFAMSLWVGIGAQLYPPLPERTMPLSLETYGCNSTYNGTDLMTTTEMPFYTSAFEIRNVERTPLMDNWYSLSYLYFSTIGTLTALLVGIFISLSTGGRKQNLDSRVLLTKEDFLSNFNFLKKQHHDLSYKSHPVEDGGTDNPAFNHMELNSTDQNAKANGTRL